MLSYKVYNLIFNLVYLMINLEREEQRCREERTSQQRFKRVH